MSRRRSDYKLTKHHLLPRSRGGKNGNGNGNEDKNDNLIYIPHLTHELWHRLFGNLTPAEVILFIHIVFCEKGAKRKRSWTLNDLYNLQLLMQLGRVNGQTSRKKIYKLLGEE